MNDATFLLIQLLISVLWASVVAYMIHEHHRDVDTFVEWFKWSVEKAREG